MRTRAPIFAVLAALLTFAGCARVPLGSGNPFHKKEPLKPFVPPPVVVRTIPQQPLVVGEPPQNTALYMDVAAIPFPVFGPPFEMPEPPKPPATRASKPAATPNPPAEVVEPPTPPPVAVPKLTQILSDEDAKKYRAEMDEASRAAEKVLEAAAKRTLNPAQTELAGQVRDFLRQAQAQQNTDLVSAKNLARRAAILAKDLQSTVK